MIPEGVDSSWIVYEEEAIPGGSRVRSPVWVGVFRLEEPVLGDVELGRLRPVAGVLGAAREVVEGEGWVEVRYPTLGVPGPMTFVSLENLLPLVGPIRKESMVTQGGGNLGRVRLFDVQEDVLEAAASAEVDVVTDVAPVPGPSEVEEAGAAMVRVSFGRAGEATGGKAGPRWGVEEVKDKLL